MGQSKQLKTKFIFPQIEARKLTQQTAFFSSLINCCAVSCLL